MVTSRGQLTRVVCRSQLERESQEKGELISLNRENIAKHLKAANLFRQRSNYRVPTVARPCSCAHPNNCCHRADELEDDLQLERQTVERLKHSAVADAEAIEVARILTKQGTLCSASSRGIELREEIHRVEATLETLYGYLRESTGSSETEAPLRDESRLTENEDSGVVPELSESGEDGALALRAELEDSVRAAKDQLSQTRQELLDARDQATEWEALANALEEELRSALAQVEHESSARTELNDGLDELQAEVKRLHAVTDELRGELATARAQVGIQDAKSAHDEDPCTTSSNLTASGLGAADLAAGSLADEMRAIDLAERADDCSVAYPTRTPRSKHGLAVPDNLRDLVYGDQPTTDSSATKSGNSEPERTPQSRKNRLEGVFGGPLALSTPNTSSHGTNLGNNLDGMSPIKPAASPIPNPEAEEWGNLTDPTVSKNFVSMLHNFDALHSDRELTVSKGEPLKILRGVVSEQWWLVKSERGDTGFVPRDYVSPFDHVLARAISQVRVLTTPPPGEDILVWFARFDYNAKDDNQVTLKKGETLEVLSCPADKKWWVVRTIDGGRKGFAPATYLKSRRQPRAPGRPHTTAPPIPANPIPTISTNSPPRSSAHRLAPRRMMGWLTQKPGVVEGEATQTAPDVTLLQSTTSAQGKTSAAWKALAALRTRKVLASMGTSVGKTKERIAIVSTSVGAKTKERLFSGSQWFKPPAGPTADTPLIPPTSCTLSAHELSREQSPQSSPSDTSGEWRNSGKCLLVPCDGPSPDLAESA